MKLFGEREWTIDRIWRLILAAIVVFAIYAILSTLRGVLLPFALAFVIAYLLSPVVSFLERHRWRRIIAVLAVLILFFCLVGAVLVAIIPAFSSEMARISTELGHYLINSYDFIVQKADLAESQDENSILTTVLDKLSEVDFTEQINAAVLGISKNVFSVLYYLVALAIVPIACFFFLSDFQRIRDGWESYVPVQLRERGLPFARDVNGVISAFFRGQLLIVMMLSLLFAIGFSIVGVPLAIIMGVIIGFLNLIPYFGTIAGMVPLVVLTLGKSLQLGENPLNRLIGVAIVMIAVQMIQDWVLTPNIMKNRVGLMPITILMSVVIWGRLLGFIGMLLAIPLSAIGKVYFHRYFLVGDGKPAGKGASPADSSPEQ